MIDFVFIIPVGRPRPTLDTHIPYSARPSASGANAALRFRRLHRVIFRLRVLLRDQAVFDPLPDFALDLVGVALHEAVCPRLSLRRRHQTSARQSHPPDNRLQHARRSRSLGYLGHVTL